MIWSFILSVTTSARSARAHAPDQANLRRQERALVERLRSGEETAFRELVSRYQGPLLRLARNFVSSQALAEEVVQETWLGVLKGLEKFEGRSSLKTWIFKILTNRARTRGVRESRTQPFSSMGGPEDAGESAVDPARFTARGAWQAPPGRWHERMASEQLLGKETLARIEEAIQQLPHSQRAVIQLRDVEGVDAASVCNILDISETNQRVLLHRARSRMRAALENYLDEA